MDGAPWDYGYRIAAGADPDRIEHELDTAALTAIPALQEVGVKTWVNGAFTFSPDGNPLVGPVPGQARLLDRLRRDGRVPAGRRASANRSPNGS